MVGSLSKYVARAPRYILQPDDNTLIRLAGPFQTPWEEGTEIQNISLSGLAFTAPSDLCPVLGDIVKIQFEVPGSGQMACMALTVRLEKASKSRTIVGIKFMKMDFPQRIYITQALSQILRQQQRQKERQSSREILRSKIPQLILAWFFLGAWIVSLWMWFSGYIYQLARLFSSIS